VLALAQRGDPWADLWSDVLRLKDAFKKNGEPTRTRERVFLADV
jgi:hypothetical protein